MEIEEVPVEEVERLNADIPKSLKRRLLVFCATHDMKIKIVTADAIENYLDIMERG